jgi:hypothetical protein
MREIAYEVVLRACGFGSLAIFCVMIGLSFEPRAAFQAWLYLPEERRPAKASAQWAISTVMRETYFMFARWTAIISIVMWVIALFFSLIGL